jgi:hypothetical protein
LSLLALVRGLAKEKVSEKERGSAMARDLVLE